MIFRITSLSLYFLVANSFTPRVPLRSYVRHEQNVLTKTTLHNSNEVKDWDKEQPKIRKSTNGSESSGGNRDDPEWKFFDTARIHVTGGDGGNGCVSFRREKGEAMGGPSGGRGGNGGTVYLVCDEGLNTLAPARNRVHTRGDKGRNGTGKSRNGKSGRDEYLTVPSGTIIRELHTQKVAGELKVHGDQFIVARGGRGGRGNLGFKSHRYTAPKLAERGEPGAARWVSLELKLVADVGFLGKPVRDIHCVLKQVL
jgi:GTP-binding protein